MADDKPKSKKKPGPVPDAPKKGRPGHNGGGWLKTGNTTNVGRKPAEIRGDILATVGEATAVMRSILDGEFKVPRYDMFGTLVGWRPATIKEFTAAYKILVDHALPNRQEVTGKDGAPIQVENAAPDIDAFLDRCSHEDLAALQAIAERTHADPDA